MRAIKRLKQASTRPSDEARYAYAPAGNPVERAELGFETTNAFNNLNQILSGSWTGSTITAVGAVNYPAGTVTVSGASGTIYADKTFDAAGVPVSPGANTLTNVFTDVFGRSVTNATSVTIANRAYVHDANGNLTSDGVFQYQYDAANQLTNVVRLADGACVLSARYDALGRRVEATRADGSVERYVYFPGSFLVLAVLDGSNAIKEVYTRGPDLSGSLDGAGGIGGILACTYASGATYCSHADIMGNVIALTDASGSVAATFRYTPFGQLSARTGSVLPRYLFSSKEFDRTVGLYYYGYRYYAPRLGQWMTRDPIGEEDDAILYGFIQNNPNDNSDSLGLAVNMACRCCCVESLDFKYIGNSWDPDKVENGFHGEMSFQFEFPIELSIHRIGENEQEGDCTFEYWEKYKSTDPEERSWSNAEDSHAKIPDSPGWNDWNRRKLPDGDGSVQTKLYDEPGLWGKNPYGFKRTRKKWLRIKVIVKSAPNCNCSRKQREKKLEIKMALKGGMPDWGKSNAPHETWHF